MKLEIEITQEDINKAINICGKTAKNGNYSITCDCPTAQAIQRIYKTERKDIFVGDRMVAFGNFTYFSDEPLREQIGLFTLMRKFKSGRYTIQNDNF